MKPSTATAGIAAALHFYGQIFGSPPGSERAEIAERAAYMALCRSPSEDSVHFEYEVWRNARYAYRRSESRRRSARDQLRVDGIAGVTVAATGGQRTPTPEEVTIATDLMRRLRTAAAGVHPSGIRTLEGMLRGESETETANALRMHVRTVRRIRHSIRQAATEVVARETR